jgi:hypothetical protein
VSYILTLSLPFRLALCDSAVPPSARQLFFECVFGCCTALPPVPCDDCSDRATMYCRDCAGKARPTAPTTTTTSTAAASKEEAPKGRWLCADHHKTHSKTTTLQTHKVISTRQFWTEQKARAAADTEAVMQACEDAVRSARLQLEQALEDSTAVSDPSSAVSASAAASGKGGKVLTESELRIAEAWRRHELEEEEYAVPTAEAPESELEDYDKED